MQWIFLVMAGLFEVFWAYELKLSQGFQKPFQSTLTVLGMVVSVYLLSLSLKSLPLGTAYAIWTGIGTLGTVLLGIFVFQEPVNIVGIVCVTMIVAGIVGLKLFSH